MRLTAGAGLVMTHTPTGYHLALKRSAETTTASGGGYTGAIPGILTSASLDTDYNAYVYEWKPVSIGTPLSNPSWSYEVPAETFYAVFLDDFNGATVLQETGNVRMMFRLTAAMYVFA